jgi:hypothetical protein
MSADAYRFPYRFLMAGRDSQTMKDAISRRVAMIRWLCFIACFLLLCSPAMATRPLMDQIVVGDERGEIVPDKCCWVELPRTPLLVEARLAEQCSAIGGPVGTFALIDNKLWLEGLLRCGGDIPLQQIYPEATGPIMASWLNGNYVLKLTPLCYASGGQDVHRRVLEINVVDGGVTVIKETLADTTACPGQR